LGERETTTKNEIRMSEKERAHRRSSVPKEREERAKKEEGQSFLRGMRNGIKKRRQGLHKVAIRTQ